MLGDLYINGTGVSQDDKKAIELYKMAVEQGYVGAIHNLGSMYCNGCL